MIAKRLVIVGVSVAAVLGGTAVVFDQLAGATDTRAAAPSTGVPRHRPAAAALFRREPWPLKTRHPPHRELRQAKGTGRPPEPKGQPEAPHLRPGSVKCFPR